MSKTFIYCLAVILVWVAVVKKFNFSIANNSDTSDDSGSSKSETVKKPTTTPTKDALINQPKEPSLDGFINYSNGYTS